VAFALSKVMEEDRGSAWGRVRSVAATIGNRTTRRLDETVAKREARRLCCEPPGVSIWLSLSSDELYFKSSIFLHAVDSSVTIR
jgi:hypothetical protein